MAARRHEEGERHLPDVADIVHSQHVVRLHLTEQRLRIQQQPYEPVTKELCLRKRRYLKIPRLPIPEKRAIAATFVERWLAGPSGSLISDGSSGLLTPALMKSLTAQVGAEPVQLCHMQQSNNWQERRHQLLADGLLERVAGSAD